LPPSSRIRDTIEAAESQAALGEKITPAPQRTKGRTIAALYMAGASITQISDLVGVKRSTVSLHIKNHLNVALRSLRPRNSSAPSIAAKRVERMYHLAVQYADSDPVELAHKLLDATKDIVDGPTAPLTLTLADPPCTRADGNCWVCQQKKATEEHHLAPKELFGEQADKWPRVMVCRGCHMEWHRKIINAIIDHRRRVEAWEKELTRMANQQDDPFDPKQVQAKGDEC